jgi:hypothetical protein
MVKNTTLNLFWELTLFTVISMFQEPYYFHIMLDWPVHTIHRTFTMQDIGQALESKKQDSIMPSHLLLQSATILNGVDSTKHLVKRRTLFINTPKDILKGFKDQSETSQEF